MDVSEQDLSVLEQAFCAGADYAGAPAVVTRDDVTEAAREYAMKLAWVPPAWSPQDVKDVTDVTGKAQAKS